MDLQNGGAQSLSALLRDGRRRLPPELATLGVFPRHPSRIGRLVTQEEISEAAGVSRVWYGRLETGAQANVSISLLGRLADVLMLDTTERAALFAAALPWLDRGTISPTAECVLDAFAWIRRATDKLYAATTELEALTIATEHIAEQFPDALAIRNDVRGHDRIWQSGITLASARVASRVDACMDCAYANLVGAELDAFLHVPRLMNAGDVGTDKDLGPYPKGALPILKSFGFTAVSYLYGRARSRGNWAAGIAVVYPVRSYSDAERAAMSALMEVTSLALS
ncbi:MAG TPA: helix-turn-helix transcriptional regulator [Candidatus Limnocylindria bacterium]|nr:helix-turn-helix transcriptional regulator [Candidatus Limnocylindria bacterium]